MLSQMPKPVLALFGMSEVNIETLGGFYAVLEFYAMIVIGCYAVSLGTSAVLRESMDKTYEFLFTKPCGRLRILTVKVVPLPTALSTLICPCRMSMTRFTSARPRPFPWVAWEVSP